MSFVEEAPKQEAQASPCPALNPPASAVPRSPASPQHTPAPLPPPIGSSWCIQDWGCGWGVAAGLKTLQASFWTPVNLPPPFKFLQRKLGLQSLWQHVC